MIIKVCGGGRNTGRREKGTLGGDESYFRHHEGVQPLVGVRPG